MQCIRCGSERTRKDGQIRLGGQRWRCNDCHRFPSSVLQPGATVAVYTNQAVRGAFSFGIGRAIWNNAGDCGFLYNAAGRQIDDYCY